MSSSSKVLLALIAGAAAGLVAGILIAPGKGSETRENISDAAKKLADELLKKAEEVIDELSPSAKK
jgi:gas vesicle protein